MNLADKIVFFLLSKSMLFCKNLKKETKENLKDKIFIKVHIIMFIGCHVGGAGQAPE